MVIRSTAPCNTQEAIPQAAMTAQGPEALFLQFCDLYNAEGNRYPGLGHLLNESQVKCWGRAERQAYNMYPPASPVGGQNILDGCSVLQG